MGTQCCLTKNKNTNTNATCTKFKPLADRVLLRRLAAEEKLKGGIILPDTAKKKQEQAEVIAVGPGKRDKDGQLIPVPVKVGNTVLIEKYTGQEITLNDDEFVVVKSGDIIAIIEK